MLSVLPDQRSQSRESCGQRSAVRTYPVRRTSRIDCNPGSIAATGSTVLRGDYPFVPQPHHVISWNNPTVGVVWADAHAQENSIVLVPDLLKSVRTTLPQSGALNLCPQSGDDASSITVRRFGDLQSFRDTPFGHELFKNYALAPGGQSSPYPLKRAAVPHIAVINVAVLKPVSDFDKHCHFGIVNLSAHILPIGAWVKFLVQRLR